MEALDEGPTMDGTTGKGHTGRKKLFELGLRRGYVTAAEIERALPEGALTPSERWLLFYSLKAAEIEIRSESGAVLDVPAPPKAARDDKGRDSSGEEEAEEALGSLEEGPNPGQHGGV